MGLRAFGTVILPPPATPPASPPSPPVAAVPLTPRPISLPFSPYNHVPLLLPHNVILFLSPSPTRRRRLFSFPSTPPSRRGNQPHHRLCRRALQFRTFGVRLPNSSTLNFLNPQVRGADGSKICHGDLRSPRPHPLLLNHSLSEEAMKALWKEIESVLEQAGGVFSDGWMSELWKTTGMVEDT